METRIGSDRAMTEHNENMSKSVARQRAYERLNEAKAARFPFPIEGRIPNFVGAERAADRLRDLPVYQKAKAIKANPDAPQLPVRAMILKDGKQLYMPTPRLRDGFVRINPEDVPQGEERRAASISHFEKYGTRVSLDEVGHIDLIITGSVAVTRDGNRAGKGEGYSDIEYAILREMGMPPVPVVTTVHSAQIVTHMTHDPHDLTLDVIVTPEETIEAKTPRPKPDRIHWDRLSTDDLNAMPVLSELRELTWEVHTVPEIIAPDLSILFVGINPGRKSAAQGHNFAGPGNHFWKLLHDAALTPTRFRPEDEYKLLDFKIGITNVVARASRGEADLSWDEMVEGGQELREMVAEMRPSVICLLGKGVYRAYAGLTRSAHVTWGLQTTEMVKGVPEYVAPNPSARSTIPYNERLIHFRNLRKLI